MSEQEEQSLAEILETAKARERAKPLKLAALATHGYLTEEGVVQEDKIEDVLFEKVLPAEVFKLSERKTTTITRTVLTRTVVPNMPGPGEYAETDDPLAAEFAFSMVNELVWRMCDSNVNGRIQQRLNSEHSLILCRTNSTSEKGVWGVYVTREWKCLAEDWIKPDQKRVERAINQQAANAEMGAARLPEFAKKFKRELLVARGVLDQGATKIKEDD